MYTIRLGKDSNGFFADVSGLNKDVDGSTPQHLTAEGIESLGQKVKFVLHGDTEWEVRIDPQTSAQLQGSQNDFLNILDSSH